MEKKCEITSYILEQNYSNFESYITYRRKDKQLIENRTTVGERKYMLESVWESPEKNCRKIACTRLKEELEGNAWDRIQGGLRRHMRYQNLRLQRLMKMQQKSISRKGYWYDVMWYIVLGGLVCGWYISRTKFLDNE